MVGRENYGRSSHKYSLSTSYVPGTGDTSMNEQSPYPEDTSWGDSISTGNKKDKRECKVQKEPPALGGGSQERRPREGPS